MAKSRIYTLHQKLLDRMLKRYGDDYRCYNCDRIFQLGDEVISKPTRKGGHVRWYHLECWEKLLL